MVLDRIEELRLQMQKIALDKDLTDPRVVKVSKKLDALINDFYTSSDVQWEQLNGRKRRA